MTSLPFLSLTSSTVFLTPVNAVSKSLATLTVAPIPANSGNDTLLEYESPIFEIVLPVFDSLSDTLLAVLPTFEYSFSNSLALAVASASSFSSLFTSTEFAPNSCLATFRLSSRPLTSCLVVAIASFK